VEHGVYVMPFFVNPTAAFKSGCKPEDIDLFRRLIPLAYTHNAAHGRPNVGLRHAWLIEHNSPLGSCSDFALLDALTPKKRSDRDKPSTSWDEYDVPTALPEMLQQRVKPLVDLVMS
jgi:CRISPR-associated protein Csd2